MALVRLARRQPRTALPPFPSAGTFPAIPSFEDLESRMNKFIERVFTEPLSMGLPEAIGWVPAMDIVENEKELTLIVELPGLEKKDVEISIEEGVLTLRGEKVEERKENGAEKKYYLFERMFGSFNRTFTLPRFVDANLIAAEFDKGVLKIHLPKTAEAETKGRKIDIAVK